MSCFPLSLGVHRERTFRLIQASLVIFIAHGLSALCTEAVYSNTRWKFPVFYAFLEFLSFTVFSITQYASLSSVYGKGSSAYGNRNGNGASPRDVGSSVYNPSSVFSDWTFVCSSTLCAVTIAIQHAASYFAFMYLHYTTAVMMKSSKVPAVVFVSFIMRSGEGMVVVRFNPRRSSSVRDGFSIREEFNSSIRDMTYALLLTVGLIVFLFGEEKESPKFSALGVFWVLLSLLAGSVTANLQEKILQDEPPDYEKPVDDDVELGNVETIGKSVSDRADESQAMVNTAASSNPTSNQISQGSEPKSNESNDTDALVPLKQAMKRKNEEKKVGLLCIQYAAGSVVYLLYCSLFSDEFEKGVEFLQLDQSILWYAIGDFILGYIGIAFGMMILTQEFDATRANVVCSVRKVFTFVLSYFFFPKPFSWFHLVGFLLVLISSFKLQWRKIKGGN